jgi:hypothetical protein
LRSIPSAIDVEKNSDINNDIAIGTAYDARVQIAAPFVRRRSAEWTPTQRLGPMTRCQIRYVNAKNYIQIVRSFVRFFF